MDTKNLFLTLNSIAILSQGLTDKIGELLIEENFKKKSLLLKQGQVAHRIYFIKQGFVRAYYDKGDDTFTNWFMGQNDIVISVYSFFSRKPSLKT